MTPFNCISRDFVLVVLIWWFRFGYSGGFVLVVPVLSVVPVVPFRRFSSSVSGFSTCQVRTIRLALIPAYRVFAVLVSL